MRLRFNRVWVFWARVKYRAILKQLSQASPTLNYGHMFSQHYSPIDVCFDINLRIFVNINCELSKDTDLKLLKHCK